MLGEQEVVNGEEQVCYDILERVYELKVAICDDEKIFVDQLKVLIYDYANKHRFGMVIDVFERGEDLLKTTKKFDIIYLDYQMSGIDGMDTARALRAKNVQGNIIFVTNYPDFVYSAFEVNTFRFIKKPIEKKDIDDSLDAYFKRFGNDYPIILYSDREAVKVETSEIIFLEALGKHCVLHKKDQTFECAKTMAEIYRMLPRNHFYKINRAFIVNFNYIDRFSSEVVVFKNGEKAYISRNYMTAFKNAYKNYSALVSPHF